MSVTSGSCEMSTITYTLTYNIHHNIHHNNSIHLFVYQTMVRSNSSHLFHRSLLFFIVPIWGKFLIDFEDKWKSNYRQKGEQPDEVWYHWCGPLGFHIECHAVTGTCPITRCLEASVPRCATLDWLHQRTIIHTCVQTGTDHVQGGQDRSVRLLHSLCL